MRPARMASSFRLVGDQRIGRERQRLVEQEQREQVLGERDPDRAAERHGEADVESRLARLVVGAHVADRVDRVDDPQRGGDEREQHAERLDLEGEREPGDDVDNAEFRPGAVQHRPKQSEHDEAQRCCRHERYRLAQVRQLVKQRKDQRADERRQQGQDEDGFGRKGRGHRSPPSRPLAAVLAIPAVHSVSKPK